MKRSHREGDVDELRRFKLENQKLKRQVSQLRKQLSRINLDSFNNLKEVLDAQEEQKQDETKVQQAKAIAQEWRCYDCDTGILYLSVFERRDGVFYWRGCENCGKRTKTKRYTSDVKGIKREVALKGPK